MSSTSSPNTNRKLQEEIIALKKEQSVLLCAHYYQALEIQDIADVVGDSLMLSKVARDNPQDTIIFAAVKFMAETASVLSPKKTILLADNGANCPMAAFAPASLVREYKKKHPGIPVALYVNSIAEAKAECDVVCTSSNAVKVITRLQAETKALQILFGPDRNLARWVREKTGIDIVYLPAEGHCYVHTGFTLDQVQAIKNQYPDIQLVVHPECNKELADAAQFVGSTAQLWNYMKDFEPHGQKFVVGTENCFVERAARDIPYHTIMPLREDARCSGMARVRLEGIAQILRNLDDPTPWEVKVPQEIVDGSQRAIERMITYSQ